MLNLMLYPILFNVTIHFHILEALRFHTNISLVSVKWFDSEKERYQLMAQRLIVKNSLVLIHVLFFQAS